MGRLNGWLRIRILERDHYTCVYCGRRPPEVGLEVDHVLPRSYGGQDDATNLVTACRECNNGKRAGLISLPEGVNPAAIPTRLQRSVRHLQAIEAAWRPKYTRRELIWPVGIGQHRGWPLPDGAWDQLCVQPHSDGFLPWAIWQTKPDWYLGFYTCEAGHAWTCGHGVVAGWSEIASFRRSPFRRLPNRGYIKAQLRVEPDQINLRVLDYPGDPAAGPVR
jgi:hypothetical protein